MELTSKDYKKSARKAIGDPVLQSALTGLQGRLGPATATLYKNLPEGPGLRNVAYQYRRKAVDNLDVMLTTLAENIRKQGGEVHFAPTAGMPLTSALILPPGTMSKGWSRVNPWSPKSLA